MMGVRYFLSSTHPVWEMLSEKAPYPCCQENPRDCGKFSWFHFEEPDFTD
jgi:hypothetical protein